MRFDPPIKKLLNLAYLKRRGAARLFAQLLISFVVPLVTLRFQPANHLAYIWPLTGVQIPMLWKDWHDPSRRRLHILASVVGYAGASFLSSWSALLIVEMSCIQAFELWATAALLRSSISSFQELIQQKRIVRFGLIVITVPFFTAGLRAVVFHKFIHASLIQTWLITGMSHSVGVMSITPALLLLSDLPARCSRVVQRWRSSVPALFLIVVVTLLVFTQTNYPWLFLIFPPVVLALLLLGMEGAAFACPIVVIIACWSLANHTGPIWLMNHSTAESRTFVLQLFLWTIAATSLPVGGLLDERERADREARAGEAIYQTLLDNSEDMIVLMSLDGVTRYVSSGVTLIAGWTTQEFLNFSMLQTMHEDDKKLGTILLDSLINGQMQHRVRYRIRCKDGSFHWVEAILRGYSDDATNTACGYVATVRDIRDQYELERVWTEEREQLTQQNSLLSALAGNDELTGLANRRTFNRMLSQEVSRRERIDNSLSLLMIDVDYFKKFNDRYGHPAGDRCLKELAGVLREACRASDICARIGGEEFVVLLPDTDETGALVVAERVSRLLELMNIEHADSAFGRVTLSIGLAVCPPGLSVDGAQLIQLADKSLYESKGSGRNRIHQSRLTPLKTI